MQLLVSDMPKRLVLSDPPEGPNKELAYIVREMTKGLTLRQAANRTGAKLSHDTIRRALDGQRVGPEKLDILALSFGRNPNELRLAAGHGLLPGYPDPRSGSVVAGNAPIEQSSQYTPEGIRVDLAYPDGRPVPLPPDLLRRLDFEIKLIEEKEKAH